MAFIETWSESTPPGSEALSNGDNRIRAFKYAIRERLAVDHHFVASEAGDNNVGYHEKTTFINQGSDPATIADAIILYAKDAATKSELHTRQEDGTISQISYLGKLWIPALDVASSARGDIIRRGASAYERLAIGTSGKYLRSDGTDPSYSALIATDLPAGSVIQVVNYQTGERATGTTILPFDDTIPQNTEGDQYMSLAITPSATTNKLRIDVKIILSHSTTTNYIGAALFQDSTANALAAAGHQMSASSTTPNETSFTYFMTAGTTSATTFKVRGGCQFAGTTSMNELSGARLWGGIALSSITITEIRAV